LLEQSPEGLVIVEILVIAILVLRLFDSGKLLFSDVCVHVGRWVTRPFHWSTPTRKIIIMGWQPPKNDCRQLLGSI